MNHLPFIKAFLYQRVKHEKKGLATKCTQLYMCGYILYNNSYSYSTPTTANNNRPIFYTNNVM